VKRSSAFRVPSIPSWSSGLLITQRLWDDMCTFFDDCSGAVCAVGGEGREANVRSSTTAEKRRVSCACLPRLANDCAMHWTTQMYITRLSRDPPTTHTVPLQHQRRCTYRHTTHPASLS